MLSREEVLKSVNELPREFTFEEVLDRLLLLDKIDIGIEQSKAGDVVSTGDAKEKLSKWLK